VAPNPGTFRHGEPMRLASVKTLAGRFVPSMRHKIDLASLYANTLTATPQSMDGQPPLPVAQVCPVPLDALLSDGS
jgi:hypothetical protein